jgi:signal transduction histidine kinase
VKFTQRGDVIRVSLRTVNGWADIQVADTGIGIRSDVLPFVFDRFRQADSRSTRAHNGLGLGLAIARHLVEEHGGTIRAQSEGQGKGTIVSIRLPVNCPASVETS